MKTSDRANELGLYASQCCGEELIFDGYDTFCACPRCAQPCSWTLMETLVSCELLREYENTLN
jgi:hypothetical protein